jgi:hypothetical protein
VPSNPRDRRRVDRKAKDPIVRQAKRRSDNGAHDSAVGDGDDHPSPVLRSKSTDYIGDARLEIGIALSTREANLRRRRHPLAVHLRPRRSDLVVGLPLQLTEVELSEAVEDEYA